MLKEHYAVFIALLIYQLRQQQKYFLNHEDLFVHFLHKGKRAGSKCEAKNMS